LSENGSHARQSVVGKGQSLAKEGSPPSGGGGYTPFADKAWRLVTCGLRFLQKKAVIVEGPLEGPVAAAETLPLDENKPYEIQVTVDLPSGRVTMKTGKTTVTATLDRRPKSITHIGYAVLNAVTDFSPMETSTEPK